MKISIVANHEEKSLEFVAELHKRIAGTPIEIDEKHPDIVLTIGGDGTLLSAFHRYAHLLHQVRFVGVHTGHLGFYTDWRVFELEELVRSLCNDQGKSVSYPLLDITVDYREMGKSSHFLALNESIIKRLTRTMVADVYIKEELFESFRGDGLSIATPTGSTGYNKSAGGAILHPRVNALQLTEVASINNRVYRTLGSPIVIANNENIQITLEDAEDYILTVDQLTFEQSNIATISYKIATERIHFASYRHTHFWRRVKDAFISDAKSGENC